MGLVHIYCGDGKGKTSAAIGLAVRMAGRGNQVVIARFLKTNDSGEVKALEYIPGVRVIECEREYGFVFSMDDETKKEAAQYYTELFEQTVNDAKEMCGLLILDEIIGAVNCNMVPEELVLNFLRQRPDNLEVVLTGRDPSEQLMEMSDYVSEIKKIRHPYEKGICARIGIEY